MTGFQIESVLGTGSYLVLLISGGILGNLFSAVINPYDIGVGASTCLFAVLGAIIINFHVTFLLRGTTD